MNPDQPVPRDVRGEPSQGSAGPYGPELSPWEIWAAIRSRKFTILAASFGMALLAAGSTYLVRPVFRAEVLVSPLGDQRNPLGAITAQFGGLAELAGVNVSGGGNRSTAIATLQSRSLAEAFIAEWNLLPVLFESAWDSTEKKWKDADPKKVPTLWDANQRFSKLRKVHDDRKTGLVTLAIEWHDPHQAAAWANELVRRANARLQQATIAEGQKTIAYLEQQSARAGALEVRQALYSLIEVETKNIAVAHAREEFAFKVIDPAVAPRRKVRPNRSFITIMGFSIGFAGSVLVALTRSVRGRGEARPTT